MKHSHPILTLSLLGLASLFGCGAEEEATVAALKAAELEAAESRERAKLEAAERERDRAIQAEAQWLEAKAEAEASAKREEQAATKTEDLFSKLPEGHVGILRKGEFSFGDSDVTWLVYAKEPLKVWWEIHSSRGGPSGGSDYRSLEGECLYQIHFTQKEVQGDEVLDDLEFFGGEDAQKRVVDADPGLAERSAYRYNWGFEVTDYEEEVKKYSSDLAVLEITNFIQFKGSVRGGGWLPGSLRDSDGGPCLTIAGAIGGDLIQYYRIGSPISLAHCVELESLNGSLSFDSIAGEPTVFFRDETDEEKVVPISEYEGRAWALQVTFSEQEE